MNRLTRVVLLTLVLALVLAAPAAATTPADVSGKWTDGAYSSPPQCEEHGIGGVVTAPMWHVWDDGSFRGRSESEWRITGHGTPDSPMTCTTTKPNCCHALLHATGTFTGDLLLGGEVYSGSFDFRLDWQVINPEPDDLTVDTFKGKLVILKGYGGLAGLHGVLDCWGRTGPTARGGRVSYAGQVHIDP
jgi:hypothetical protein